jgi:drug/metabolite transporter (DMT)-like permease
VLAVLVVSQAVGLLGIAIWIALSGEPPPGAAGLLPAAGAGLAGLVGLAALYRGLAIGAMGVVAPISAASPVVPLAVDAARGIVPSPAQWAGVALILTGVVTLSREPGPRGSRTAAGVGLALVAALGFGSFVVGIDLAADESASWAVLVSRATSVSIALAAAVLTSTSLRAPRDLLPALVAIGVFDTGANVLVAFATTHGSAGIVGVLSAIYPLATIVLARIVLDERLDAARRMGAAVALLGAALVAAG